MTNSRSIIGIAVVAGVLIFSIWLGVSIVTNQIETLAQVVGVTILLACALLGRRIWMILPFMGAINLSLMIPGQPTTTLLAQALFVSFCSLLFLMRKLPFKPAFSEIGFWVLLLSLCVVQTYVRNPVGLNIFGGDSVGARPYVLFAVALVSSVLLGTFRVPSSELRWIVRLSIFGGVINFMMLAVGYYIPSVGVWYGAMSPEAGGSPVQQHGEYGVDRASRITFVRDIGRNLSLWISSFISPIRACFHPLWAPFILLSFAFAAFSGYRNEIGAVGLTYLVAIAYRGGAVSVLVASLALVMSITLLAMINLATPLPSNIQRSLSFLPGTWDQAHIQDSQDSTEWRVEMWKEALLTDIWIQNKVLGDGLGMSKREFDYILSFTGKQTGGAVGTGKLTRQQEFMMASGSYHSGPVSTIRAIGHIGLLVLILAQIRLAVHAHRQIQRAKNTEWFPLALLIGIPLIWSPVFFVFVFGDFGAAAASFLMGAAMIRLLENNLPLPVWQGCRRNPRLTHAVGNPKPISN